MYAMALRGVLKNVRAASLWVKYYSSSAPLLDVSINDKTGVSTLTMNRPPVNSLNFELLRDLGEALKLQESNKSRGVILTSVRNHVFANLTYLVYRVAVIEDHLFGRPRYNGNV